MKKAKRKNNKAKHRATAMHKSKKMVRTEIIKQIVPRRRETVRDRDERRTELRWEGRR